MGTEWNIQPMWWCLGRLWPSGLRSASIQSTWLHTKDNTARSNGWICGSPRFDRLYRECVQPVLLLLLQRGPVMIRKPRPPAMIEEKHVEKEEPQQITTSYTAILLSLQYALGQAPPSQPNQPASTRHAIPIQSIVITARKKNDAKPFRKNNFSNNYVPKYFHRHESNLRFRSWLSLEVMRIVGLLIHSRQLGNLPHVWRDRVPGWVY